jgi:hypothetical protein
MSYYRFHDPQTGFRALITAPSGHRAKLRAALLNLSVLGHREGNLHPRSLCRHHGPLPEGIAHFDDDFFCPMEIQLTSLLARCAIAEGMPPRSAVTNLVSVIAID